MRLFSCHLSQSSDEETVSCPQVLVQRTIDMINKVSEARSIRETATHNNLSWITLLFLLEMATITFFGVTLLQNGRPPSLYSLL